MFTKMCAHCRFVCDIATSTLSLNKHTIDSGFYDALID